MKRLLLFTCILLFILCGCKNKNNQIMSAVSAQTDTITNPVSSLLTDTVLPQFIDLKQDISHLSFQELRLLRSYPYAIHGYHFMEADINAFFSANTKWYNNLVNDIYWDAEEGKGKFAESYEEVNLTPEEKAFVDRIDARMTELRQHQFIQRDSYYLGNTNNIVNLFQFKDIDKEILEKLQQNNFVITKGNNLQLFHAYEENDYRQVPNFITTDLYLQAFHMYFSYILKSLEKQHIIPTLEMLCHSFNAACIKLAEQTEDESLKDMAEHAATFYAIPYYLLTNKTLTVPSKYETEYQEEIEHINKQEDNFSDFLSYKDAYFPYSLFKPRGHYTREPQLQAYFKAMMWLQTACFCREQQEQLKRSIFQAAVLCTYKSIDQTPLIKLYQHIYTPLTFLMGEADNLSIFDIARILEKNNAIHIEDALTARQIEKVNQALIELAKHKNNIKPQIEITCRDKINFMPQRYLSDNEVIQKLVDVNPNSQRAYPKGLDVFATFGTGTAESLLIDFYKEPNNWSEYSKELQQLKDKFKTSKSTQLSVYELWMKSLLTMQQTDKNNPGFMQTPEWGYKNLNTALASWAELKHDAILYGEQPMAAECGGAGPPDPIVVGYVEPNLPFWRKMENILQATRLILQQNDCMTDDLKGKTDQLNDYVTFLIQVTEKELRGEKLTEPEYRTLEYMGSSIEYFTLSVVDPDLHLDDWSLVQGPDKSIAIVADIYTRNIRGCNKNGILHIATGNANNIYVVVEIEGNLYLTRGATFSYYEFVQPLGTRLTDEEWQKMLEEKKAPAVPEWMKSILIEKEPHVNERVFYSSGC
ncbi:DUF3160 domain-containing protein [Bacteroides finegoldii]|uniref:DUF3160 domain-containing protein n=1 Tax=Bacteroides finegoldii TaxID=338188 RepID=UPI00234C9F5A|nr:DUF3160 domain-containing protein [Bacteroides finegoldii]MDC7142507.1 DUF3160 domain-containing protein [Bacteroides finegoldii]